MDMQNELDELRAEWLRSKIIFDAELRRQREVYEARLAVAEEKLQDRETDCKNLQNVITILGRRLDALQDHVATLVVQKTSNPGTPRQSPSRPEQAAPHATSSPFRRQSSPMRQAMTGKKESATTPLLFSGRAPSLNTFVSSSVAVTGSRASSPGRMSASTVGSSSANAAGRPKVLVQSRTVTNTATTTPRTIGR